MNSKKAMMFVIVCGIVIVGVMIGIRVWVGRPRNPITVSEVTSIIQEAVPLGSNKTQVDVFLRSKGIGHSHFNSAQEDFNGWSDVVMSGVPVKQVGAITTATIHDTSRALMITGDMRIVFLFDKNGKLVKHTVKEVFTGP